MNSQTHTAFRLGDMVRLATFPRYVGQVVELLDPRMHGGVQWYRLSFDAMTDANETIKAIYTTNTADELVHA